MKLEVLQENLNKALTIATRIVSSKPQLPILSNLLLKVTSNGCVLETSNVESSLKIPFGAKVEEVGELLVPARTFQELVASLNKAKLTLEAKENSLLVSESKFQGKIVCSPNGDFPSPSDDQPGVDWSLSSKVFQEALSQTIFSSAVDEGRAVLNGVLFKFGDSPLFVSTDGFRLSEFILPKGTAPKSDLEQVIVPSKSLLEVQRLITDSENDQIKVSLTPSQVKFTVDDINFYSQVIAGNFPNFEKIIPTESVIKLRLNVEELSQSIRTASIFARENANIIRFVLEGKVLKIRAQGGEVGENETELDVEVEKGSNDEFNVAFNFRYLLEFLNSLKNEKDITVEFGTATSAAVFRPAKSENYLHIIMPVRVQS